MATNTPEHKKFVFVQNEKRNDIYDLKGEPDSRLFHYFRISTPRKPFLIKQGARFVIESWSGHEKTSFTGLIPIKIEGWYYGDLLLKRANKQPAKSFLIANINGNETTLYLFPNFTLYPAKRLNFCHLFAKKIIEQNNNLNK
ncbi:MAG: hypothetical protein H6537_06870 [Bacteroidales bacterium]|nr:hypothetical protein [Bacteroidales bacterium]